MQGAGRMTDEDRRDLIGEINSRFGVTLQWFEQVGLKLLQRDDVMRCGFFTPPDEQPPGEDVRLTIRRYVENRGWMFSRQRQRPKALANPRHRIEYIYLAPMICVQLERAYHATRLVSIDSIRKDGLLPGNSERQTTKDRCDCEGNI